MCKGGWTGLGSDGFPSHPKFNSSPPLYLKIYPLSKLWQGKSDQKNAQKIAINAHVCQKCKKEAPNMKKCTFFGIFAHFCKFLIFIVYPSWPAPSLNLKIQPSYHITQSRNLEIGKFAVGKKIQEGVGVVVKDPSPKFFAL